MPGRALWLYNPLQRQAVWSRVSPSLWGHVLAVWPWQGLHLPGLVTHSLNEEQRGGYSNSCATLGHPHGLLGPLLPV